MVLVRIHSITVDSIPQERINRDGRLTRLARPMKILNLYAGIGGNGKHIIDQLKGEQL